MLILRWDHILHPPPKKVKWNLKKIPPLEKGKHIKLYKSPKVWGSKNFVFGGGFKRSFSLLFFRGSAGFQLDSSYWVHIIASLAGRFPQMKKFTQRESQVGLSSDREKTWKPTRVDFYGFFLGENDHPIGWMKGSTKTAKTLKKKTQIFTVNTTPLSQNPPTKTLPNPTNKSSASTGKIPKSFMLKWYQQSWPKQLLRFVNVH